MKDEAEDAGLADLVVLVVNRSGDEGGIAYMEDYTLPILQDTAEDDVFGLYEARDYDVFVVGRDGSFSHTATGVHPLEARDHDALLEALLDAT